ncbi:MAG TPA: tetratricopeptide repeat protein [Nanoarchaeota archaeon]|nr:tetratricopeptide repeat protein [Nanoarchaeota archaeon]
MAICSYPVELTTICDKMDDIDRAMLRYRRGGEAIGQLEGLLEQYKEIAAREPEYLVCAKLGLNLLFNLGCAYEQGGKLEKAVEIHEELLRLNPTDHQAMYNAGTNLVKLFTAFQNRVCGAQYRQDLLDRAIILLRKAVELNPENPNYMQNLEEAFGIKMRLQAYADIRGDGNRRRGPIC